MKVIDLFCGGGGFSLGADWAGFEVSAAFDIDATLTSSFASNFPRTKLTLGDVTDLSGSQIERISGGRVDGVFGGPPCQGFSDIGRRDAADPRRQLLIDFFRLINELQPTFFVMENVRGLMYADARHLLDNGIDLIADSYDIIGPVVWDAAEFGAATKRRRLFVIGLNSSRCDPLSFQDIASVKRPPTTVRAAIGDLSGATREADQEGFDVWRIRKPGRPTNYARSMRSSDLLFTGHRRTIHTSAVVARFATVEPGAIDAVGRHPRLRWDGQCPSMRAGTGADRGSYQSVRPIHPSEPRVITVREAARLQGFPDAYRFHPTIWHSFRMIGNSVSPMISRAIFSAIAPRVKLQPKADIAAE